MHHIFSPKSTVKYDTMDFNYHRILTKGVELKETEIMELCDFCLAEFSACDLQLPQSFAERLSECGVPLDAWFEFALTMMTMEFDDNPPSRH